MPRSKKSAGTSSISSDLAALKVDPARVEQTVRWLISGARDADVVEAIATAWPDQALQPLITAAVEQLAAAADVDGDVILGFCIEATRDLYRRMTEIGDYAGALRAIKQLRELAA